MSRRPQSAPAHSQPQSQTHSPTTGFKGLLAALMPKRLLHSVTENAKRTASPKRPGVTAENRPENGTRRYSFGGASMASVDKNRRSKEQDLDFSRLGLKSSKGLILFRNVKKPEAVETVRLDHNRFESLPEDLSHCIQLRVLSAMDNDLTSVPNWIASLISLNRLDLRKNSIQLLPESFKCLKRLSVLNLSFNPLTSIDHSLVHCSNLNVLYLNDCCLQFLPATIGRLHNLQILELRNNNLQSLPSGLCRLSRLEFLDVGGNRLLELPEALCGLRNLKVLLADDNRITKLPQIWDGLHALEFFDVSNNALKDVSVSLGNLPALETLILSDNYLSTLPSTFGNLTSLKLLRVDRNGLKHLPPTFGKLRLKEFSAIGNELSELPSAFYQLCQLEVLFLDQNRLRSFSESLGDLRNLSILSLRGNQIESLPETLANLLRLVTLDLRENRLHSLPTGVTELSSLRALWLSHNQAIPKLNLNCDVDTVTRQKILTCYLLPQQNQTSDCYLTSKRDCVRGRPSKTKRITFESDTNCEHRNNINAPEPSVNSADSKPAVGLRRFPPETAHALEILDAQHGVMVRTETSFGSMVRQAKVVRSGKISPRLLYQLDKIKNEQRRSIMFQSSAFTIVRNQLESSSSVHGGASGFGEKPTLFRPPSFIRPYAMIDLKTLQAQVEAERHQSYQTSGAILSNNTHEYEAIFDFKKKKNIARSMVKNDFQCLVQQNPSVGRYNSCFNTVSEEMNQYSDLNRSF